MKIVHLSLEDSFGAGRAAVRISKAVSRMGEDSSVWVLQKNEMADSSPLALSRLERIMVPVCDRINHMLLDRYPEHGYFHVDRYGIDLTKYEVIQEADIVHFHWVNEGIWSEKLIRSLIRLNKPVVWTMHDMWAFTGGCHYDDSCGKYKTGCGNCPVLGSAKAKDESFAAVGKKRKWLEQLNIRLVGCSRWITGEANLSAVCSGMKNRAVCIPNSADEQGFQLYDQEMCRKILGVPQNKKMILFGAVNAASDKRKGGDYLLEALRMLDPEKYVLGIFGSKEVNLGLEGFEIINFGRLSDDLHLSLIYNAADVFVAPSVQENLANTVMEALTCGTPAVAFDIGGMSDMILPGENGYLAKPFDVTELARGIEDMAALQRSKEEIRKTVSERFSLEKVGEAYRAVYEELLQ